MGAKRCRKNKQLSVNETEKTVSAMHKMMESEYNDKKILREQREEAEENFNKQSQNHHYLNTMRYTFDYKLKKQL